MAYLSAVQLHNQGDCHGLVEKTMMDGPREVIFILNGFSSARGTQYIR
jgi:hypothetical protein